MEPQKGWPRRASLLLLTLVPLAALVAIFSWALARSGGNPGGLGVNNKLGDVRVRQEEASDFTLVLFSGEQLPLADLRGQAVMVDFWASWCPPCRKEAPVLAQVHLEYRDRGVEFLGVAIWDSEEAARSHIQRYGVAYPNGLDVKGRVAIDYGVAGIPEKFFIDSSGRVVKRFVGPMTPQRLRSVLDSLLEE